MFNVLLRRTHALTLPSWVQSTSHEFLSNALEKITFITPERLVVTPCTRPPEIHRSGSGIPFDLPAVLWLLTESPKKKDIFDHLTKGATFSEDKPMFLFCGGSKFNGGLPVIQIAGSISVSSIPFDDPRIWINGYALKYAA